MKEKVNVSFQVNMDFFEKIEAIRDDSGFESTSELCREAVRTFIRKEAWQNRMMKNYLEKRDGGKPTE